jgi:large subunit ribosomal protein L13
MKTYTARAGDVERKWLLVDAEGKTLGRLATQIAMVLRGKHKPTYTPHLDTGDFVIVVNASKVRLTGAKIEKEQIFRHTMYPGGVKWTSLKDTMAKHPERVFTAAVRGMVPRTKLGRAMMKKLKVYAGAEHPHEAQRPEAWTPTTRARKA